MLPARLKALDVSRDRGVHLRLLRVPDALSARAEVWWRRPTNGRPRPAPPRSPCRPPDVPTRTSFVGHVPSAGASLAPVERAPGRLVDGSGEHYEPSSAPRSSAPSFRDPLPSLALQGRYLLLSAAFRSRSPHSARLCSAPPRAERLACAPPSQPFLCSVGVLSSSPPLGVCRFSASLPYPRGPFQRAGRDAGAVLPPPRSSAPARLLPHPSSVSPRAPPVSSVLASTFSLPAPFSRSSHCFFSRCRLVPVCSMPLSRHLDISSGAETNCRAAHRRIECDASTREGEEGQEEGEGKRGEGERRGRRGERWGRGVHRVLGSRNDGKRGKRWMSQTRFMGMQEKRWRCEGLPGRALGGAWMRADRRETPRSAQKNEMAAWPAPRLAGGAALFPIASTSCRASKRCEWQVR